MEDIMSYATVNGLDLYYEEHGTATGTPLVLLHGALSGIGTSFGAVLPYLAKGHRVIAVEFQAHGHTADIGRPLTVSNLADDVVGLLDHLGVERADVFGFSLGAGVALDLGLRHPGRVGRLVLASVAFDNAGFHPGVLDGIDGLRPEHLHGSPFHAEYLATAPDPAGFGVLVEKVKDLDRDLPQWPAETVRSLAAPTLLVLGDSDIIRPEHVLELFRLLGGGVAGDVAGLPRCRLAVLPGTTHIGVPARGEWLSAMIDEFLAA
jgi:pimeloyl-ACP methyl ester carboxylesterase